MNFNIAGGWFEFAEPHLTRLFAKLVRRLHDVCFGLKSAAH